MSAPGNHVPAARTPRVPKAAISTCQFLRGRGHPARHQRARVGPRQYGQTGMIQVEQNVGYPEKGRHRRHRKVPVVARPDDRNREREAGQEQAIDDDSRDRWSGNDQNPARYHSPTSATSRPPVGVAMPVQFCAAVSRNPAVRAGTVRRRALATWRQGSPFTGVWPIAATMV